MGQAGRGSRPGGPSPRFRCGRERWRFPEPPAAGAGLSPRSEGGGGCGECAVFVAEWSGTFLRALPTARRALRVSPAAGAAVSRLPGRAARCQKLLVLCGVDRGRLAGSTRLLLRLCLSVSPCI